MVRVGLIGRFGHAYVGLQAVAQTKDAKLVGYAPVPPEETLAAFDVWRDKLGDVRGYATFEEMIDKEKPDVVQVSGAFYRNGEVAAYAAAHGCNVLVEKPIATTLEGLSALKAAVDRGGVRLSAMLGSRLAGTFRAAKAAIAAGAIGEPLQAYAQKSYKFGQSRPDFYRERRKYGGTLPWIAIHAIDWIHWLLADPFASVTASHRNFTLKTYPGCEDVSAALFGLRNGGSALVSADYLRPSGSATHGDDRIRITGSAGVIEVIGNQSRVALIDAHGERDLPVEPGEGNIMLALINCLARGDEHPVSVADSFRVTEVALKARDSADQGGKVVGLLDSPYSKS